MKRANCPPLEMLSLSLLSLPHTATIGRGVHFRPNPDSLLLLQCRLVPVADGLRRLFLSFFLDLSAHIDFVAVKIRRQ